MLQRQDARHGALVLASAQGVDKERFFRALQSQGERRHRAGGPR